MKLARKLVTLAIVLAMVMAFMVPTAMAASDGSITIANTTQDATYSVYKVFDATYADEKVAYTYDGSNSVFLNNLKGEDSPFTVTQVFDENVYTVVRKDSVTDAAIIEFIKENKDNFGTATTVIGDANDVTVNNLAYGYYYITTTTGAFVTIDSALKDVTVIDKNEKLTAPVKAESVDGGTTWVDTVTASVGDTVKYKVTGKIQRYQGENLITKLVFTDTMTDGLTAIEDVVVKIGDNEMTADQDYTVAYANGVTTITIPTATVNETGVTYNYNVGVEYEITYSVTVDADTITDGVETNTVELKYNTDNTVGSDVTTVKNYQVTLNKINVESAKLANAKFKLYDAATNGNEIPVVLVSGTGNETSTEDNVYRPAMAGETGVVMVTGTTGAIVIKGLENGDYYFEETEAPAGYNKLTTRTQAAVVNNANVTIDVENNTGLELPTTGGIGTTIFYVLGGVLFLGALVILFTNKRMRQN